MREHKVGTDVNNPDRPGLFGFCLTHKENCPVTKAVPPWVLSTARYDESSLELYVRGGQMVGTCKELDKQDSCGST